MYIGSIAFCVLRAQPPRLKVPSTKFLCLPAVGTCRSLCNDPQTGMSSGGGAFGLLLAEGCNEKQLATARKLVLDFSLFVAVFVAFWWRGGCRKNSNTLLKHLLSRG